MKHLPLASLVVFLSCHFFSFSQGLNFEKGLNNAYYQEPENMICDDQYSYFVYYESLKGHLLTKLDTLGNEEWNINVIRPSGGSVESIALAEDTAIYVSGYVSACDVFDSYDFITKISRKGHVIWSKVWIGDIYNGGFMFNHFASGFNILSSGNIARQLSDESSHLYILDHNSSPIDSLTFLDTQFQGFAEYGPNLLAYSENKIWEITPSTSSSGTVVERRIFSSPIQNMIPFGDKFYVLTTHALHELDSDLNNPTSIEFGQNQFASNLKIIDDNIHCLISDSVLQTIITFNSQMELIDSFSLSIENNEDAVQDYSSTHFSRAVPFDLTLYKSIRFFNYSQNDTHNAPVMNTDIELVNINMLDYVLSPSVWVPNAYHISTQVEVLIKNTGMNTMHSAVLNRKLDIDDVCEEGVYSIELNNLNLAPGDSTWITLNRDASKIYIPIEATGNSINFNLCFYSSHPNGQTDLNVTNDEICRDFSIQYVGNKNVHSIDISIHPNPAMDFIEIENLPQDDYQYQIFDLQGRRLLYSELGSNYIDVSGLNEGSHFLHISNLDGSVNASSLFVKY